MLQPSVAQPRTLDVKCSVSIGLTGESKHNMESKMFPAYANSNRRLTSYHSQKRLLGLERVEDRLCLTALPFATHPLEYDSGTNFYSAAAADLDGDGDMDILSASDQHRIEWYENMDGKGAFSTSKVITSAADKAYDLFTADVDSDGDLDVLSASLRDNKIAWYENTDGKATFGEQQIINLIDGATHVHAADVDSDGDVDILSTSQNDDKISWYENLDGKGEFSDEKTISIEGDRPVSVVTADIDGDGDLDVLAASHEDHKVSWYENVDGLGDFGLQRVISDKVTQANDVVAADVDGDGDLDVVSAAAGANEVAWHENVDGKGTFGLPQVITSDAQWIVSLETADLDGDGDLDVLSTSVGDDKIAWYENSDGRGDFRQHVLNVVVNNPLSAKVADVDHDGDLDIISASSSGLNKHLQSLDPAPCWGHEIYIDIHGIVAGDANDDGRVDFADFLIVSNNFGRTETTRHMGDFNGDNEVNFSDFLVLSSNFGASTEDRSASPTARTESDPRYSYHCSFPLRLNEQFVETHHGIIAATRYLVGVVPRLSGSDWDASTTQAIFLDLQDPTGAVEIPTSMIIIPPGAVDARFEIILRLDELPGSTELVTIGVVRVGTVDDVGSFVERTPPPNPANDVSVGGSGSGGGGSNGGVIIIRRFYI